MSRKEELMKMKNWLESHHHNARSIAVINVKKIATMGREPDGQGHDDATTLGLGLDGSETRRLRWIRFSGQTLSIFAVER